MLRHTARSLLLARGRRAASTSAAPPAARRSKLWAPPTPAHRLRANGAGLRWTGGQDRVNANGELVVGGIRQPGAPPPPVAVVGARAAPGRSTVPDAAPLTADDLERLADAVASARNVVVLTGAGVSTASGVPDYRSPGRGAYATGFVPVTHQQFVSSPSARARYWARSFAGWPDFCATRPNGAHAALASLERGGWVGRVITQNVDRLHQAAGSRAVLELHGTTHVVKCLTCGIKTPRAEFQDALAAANPGAAAAAAERAARAAAATAASPCGADEPGGLARAGAGLEEAHAGSEAGAVAVPVVRPDGDVELADAGEAFIVPPCPHCGGVHMPDVTFFGACLEPAVAAAAKQAAAEADLLLAVGTSLQVFSAFRLAQATLDAGGALAVVNIGPTRADEGATLKIPARADEALARLAAHPRLAVPRPYGAAAAPALFG